MMRYVIDFGQNDCIVVLGYKSDLRIYDFETNCVTS